MGWYVLQVMTGTERDACTALRRKGVQARAPAQRMNIRRRGQWHEEECLLLPGYIFVGADYSAALFMLFPLSPASSGGWDWSAGSRRRWTHGTCFGGGWRTGKR